MAQKAPRAPQWDKRFAYEPAEAEKIPPRLLGFLTELEQPEASYRLSRYVREDGRRKLRTFATLTPPADADPGWIASHIAGAAVAMVSADTEATGRCQCQARWGSDENRSACEFEVEDEGDEDEGDEDDEDRSSWDARDNVIAMLTAQNEQLHEQLGELIARQQAADNDALKRATATIFELHEGHAGQVWKLRERYEDLLAAERERADKAIAVERERADKMIAVERERADQEIAKEREAVGAERMRYDAMLDAHATRYDLRIEQTAARADKLASQQSEAGLKMYELALEAGKPNTQLVSSTLGVLAAGVQMMKDAGAESAAKHAAELEAKHQEGMHELASDAIATVKDLAEHWLTVKFGAEGRKIAETARSLSGERKKRAEKPKQTKDDAKQKSEKEEKKMYGNDEQEENDALDYTTFRAYPRLLAAIGMLFDPVRITADDWAVIRTRVGEDAVAKLRKLEKQDPLELEAFAEAFESLRSVKDPQGLLEALTFNARAVITELGSSAMAFNKNCEDAMSG